MADRKEGYGWRLLPVAKTPEAFDQIYRLRMTIEPAAMLEPSFELDRKVLAEQRRIQEQMLENDLGCHWRLLSYAPISKWCVETQISVSLGLDS